MDGLFRLRDFVVRHTYVNSARLHKLDRKIEDRECPKKTDALERLRKIYKPPVFSCDRTNIIGESKYNLQIIIPMYNVQRYVFACLDSIFSQNTKYTYKVIVVDDGSTDAATALITEKYKDKNITILKQRNKGTAAARNVGFAEIEADYVMFVDADDILKQGAIESLLNTAYENDACIVEGGYENFSRGVPISISHAEGEVTEPCGYFWGFAWAKVFKAQLLADVCFPDGYYYEDTIVSYILYPKCSKAYAVRDIVYRYRRNPRGFSRIRGNDVKLLDSFWVFYHVLKVMRERQVTISQGIYESILRSMVNCCKRLLFMNDEIRKEVLNAFSEILITDFDGFKCEDSDLAIFEKTVRNNDYYKFKRILVCMRE